MKRIITFCVIVTLSFLCGCAGSGDIVSQLVKLPTGEIVSAATDRWGSWERVKQQEETTKQKSLELLIEKEQKANNVEIKIDTKDEMAFYALQQANAGMVTIAVALATGGRSPYEAFITNTPMLKGAFAEFLDSFFDGGAKILRTPSAQIGSAGYALGEVMGGYQSGRTQEYHSGGGDITVDHKETDIAIGNENEQTDISGEQSGSCPGGVCEEDDVENTAGVETLAGCTENPPGGFSESGTPMYNATLSCGSFYGGE